MTLGHDLMLVAALVEGLVVLGTLVVVAKAVIAYRQHASRPLRLVGIGLFLLLVGPPSKPPPRRYSMDRPSHLPSAGIHRL